MMFDRIEWLILPDDATKAAALQNGEVDWWENPIPDLVPLLKRNRNLNVDIADPLGNIGSFRMNHLHPPFNDVRARRAVMMALSQEDYMRAVVGDDETLWKPLPSFFTPGTPVYTEAGGDILKGRALSTRPRSCWPRPATRARRSCCWWRPTSPITKAQGDVTADLLQKIGMNVDYQALDWGTVGARRAKKDPPSQGGWNIFHTWHAGADCTNPAPYTALDCGGDKAWFGWPNSPKMQTESRLVRRPGPRGREEGDRRPEQGRDGLRDLHRRPGSSCSTSPGGRTQRRGQGAVPGVLGRPKDLMFA